MGFKTWGDPLGLLFTGGYRFTFDAVEKFEWYIRLFGLTHTKSLVGIDTLRLGGFQYTTAPVTIAGQKDFCWDCDRVIGGVVTACLLVKSFVRHASAGLAILVGGQT